MLKVVYIFMYCFEIKVKKKEVIFCVDLLPIETGSLDGAYQRAQPFKKAKRL